MRFRVNGLGLKQLLHRNVQRFHSELVFKAHRLLYHSALGLGVIKKKRRVEPRRVRSPCARTRPRARLAPPRGAPCPARSSQFKNNYFAEM